MANLAELLAAKRAKEDAAKGLIDAVANEADKNPTGYAPKELKDAAQTAVNALMETKTISDPKKEEPANTAVPKPMSFAEKMALRRKEQEAQKTESKDSVNSGGDTIHKEEVPKEQAPVNTAPAQDALPSSAKPADIPASVDTGTSTQQQEQTQDTEVSPEARQAYADIKAKLEVLNSMSGTDLESSMKELKKALMANPAAVSLMEDSDIGQMVIALRKITGETIAEAAKEKKNGNSNGNGRKTKQVDLSDAAAVAQIFDEL